MEALLLIEVTRSFSSTPLPPPPLADMRRRDPSGGQPAFVIRPYQKADEEVEFDAWAKGLRGGTEYSFFGEKSDSPRSGAWARRRVKADDGEGEFKSLGKEEVDSDIPSPKLWEQGGSPVAARTSPVRQLSSRQQAIVRYRQEMMDLVSDGPESAYELSLKDMVELPRTVKLAQKEDKGKGRKKGDSMETGSFLLKMFLPFSLGGKGRRKAKGGKVSPKPVAAAEGEKGADREWWNSSSTGSSGSSIGPGRRKLSGCYSFITKKKSRINFKKS